MPRGGARRGAGRPRKPEREHRRDRTRPHYTIEKPIEKPAKPALRQSSETFEAALARINAETALSYATCGIPWSETPWRDLPLDEPTAARCDELVAAYRAERGSDGKKNSS